jgi:DNA-binding MarR family transcriptional regulator
MDKRKNEAREASMVSPEDYAVLAGFRHTLREFIHFSEEAAAAAGVPPHQHQAMLIIRGLSSRGCVTIGEIAGQLLVRHQSAVGLVNRMVKRGLVRKLQDSADHRAVIVRLTAAGERVLRRLSAAHKAEIARLGPILQTTIEKIKTA